MCIFQFHWVNMLLLRKDGQITTKNNVGQFDISLASEKSDKRYTSI